MNLHIRHFYQFTCSPSARHLHRFNECLDKTITILATTADGKKADGKKIMLFAMQIPVLALQIMSVTIIN
jgi:hypothetical protein